MMKTTARPELSDQIVVVHNDYAELMKLTVALGAMRYRVTSAHATHALRRAVQLARLRPRALVVSLDGTETVTDVRELVETAAPAPALLLSPRMPPRPAMARIVNEQGGAILARGESALVVVSTLVSPLAQHSGVER
jgi:hypothetical protein